MNTPIQPNERAVLRKVAWRLIPFMGVLYLLAFLDRVNIGFAALTMNADLAFSATVFGNGAGIFFLGYVLFEIPSNPMLHKVGARRWIARIMITWVWLFGLIYFALLIALYGYNFWLPQIIQALGSLSHREIGYLALLPNLIAAAVMYGWGRHSDATRERRWHSAVPMFVAATGLAIAGYTAQPVVALIGLTLGAIGIYATLPVFWTLPTAMLSGAAAANGIALINSVGNAEATSAPRSWVISKKPPVSMAPACSSWP